MKVSLNIIKQFTDVNLKIEDLVAKINSQLGGVEEIINLHEKYKDAVIVRVVECHKHENADKLSVCTVDVGKKELVKVVCGASNVHNDMWAIWLPPGATVPASYGDAKPFVLDVREIRGEISHGMLAAADELGIGSDHSGIIELHDNDVAPGLDVKKLVAGQKFADVFGLNDTVIDIENKMFTHRPDLFGQLGVAREIAGIQHQAFTSPHWYDDKQKKPVYSKSNALPLKVTNDVEKFVPRFMAVGISGIEVKPSPMWLQCALIAMGGKPINNMVDITNYIMLITSQPTHAYDYDTLSDATLGARTAKVGETVQLLNGKKYVCDTNDIVIVDGKGPVGLAGIMGGSGSEVSKTTKNVVLEVANFDMYAVRKTSMRHGLFTDALTRFNKGQSPLQNEAVMHRLIQMILNICGGSVASELHDAHAELQQTPTLKVTSDFINDRLGSVMTPSEMRKLLKNVEFEVDEPTNKTDTTLSLRAPFWRTDIELPEDVVEEVGRLYGFDLLPLELPLRSVTPAPVDPVRNTKKAIRESMKRLGANEAMTYSFVHENVIRRAEQDIDQAFKLTNALSPDLQYYRLSVLPSLLDKVHMNVKSGHDEFVLYEIGKGHNKKYHAADDGGLPTELQFVDAVYTRRKPQNSAPYYAMRQYLKQLAYDLGAALVFKPVDTQLDFPVTAPFDQSRSALVETTDGLFVGMVGELRQSVLKNFKLPQYSAAMTLDLSSLVEIYSSRTSRYKPLSRFPAVTQDISLKVPTDTLYCNVEECLVEGINTSKPKDTTFVITPVSIYSPVEPSSRKTITFRITISSNERTLTDKDVNKTLDDVAEYAHKTVKATRV
jgi:phenylalanyl-tRNA synthetase beta chain